MTNEEKQRYSRQTRMEGIGLEGQEKLRRAKVAVVGCGALGSMVAMQLAGAGVGNIVIADFDTIDISNLQRQFFYRTEEAGKRKADVLAERMTALNDNCRVTVVGKMIDRMSGESIFKDCDFIVDATDNASSKMMVGEVCRTLGKYCSIGGVSGYHGQVMTICPGEYGLAETFQPEPEEGFLPCAIEGVFGPAASLCASLQASEVIKHLLQLGTTLQGKVFTFDLRSNTFNTFLV